MNDILLTVKNLTFSVEGKSILSEVSFSVKKGERVSIIGPNGAGKTTLLRCLSRVLKTWTGDVLLQGTDLRRWESRAFARLTGYVPQLEELSIPFSVGEFVMTGLYPHVNPFSRIGKKEKDRVMDSLSRVGMAPFYDRPLITLSGGERQRVLIASCLVQGAQLLYLDEPTAYLDPLHQEEILRLLLDLNTSQGTTIVSVTHDINHAILTSGRILALHSGRLVFNGSPEDLMRGQDLEEIYGKRFTRVPHPVMKIPMVLPEGLP